MLEIRASLVDTCPDYFAFLANPLVCVSPWVAGAAVATGC